MDAETSQPVDLNRFCSTHPTRYKLHAPFTIGVYTYASDGRICIRVPSGGAPATADAPNVAKLDFDEPADLAPVQLPEVMADKSECPKCEGSGTAHDCPDCGCACERCGGSGTITEFKPPSVAIAGLVIDSAWLPLLENLPDMRAGISRGGYVYIKFAGGVVLIAPMASGRVI